MKCKWKKLAAVGAAMAFCVSAMSVPVSAMDAYIYVKSIAANKKAVTLYVGAGESKSSVKLKATVKPSIVKATWISTNKKVASVSQKGLVKAKKAGKATIIAKAASRQAQCKVTVKKITRKVKQITAEDKMVIVNKGKTKKLNITVLPKDATLKTVTYKSANKKIATVSQMGMVKGIKVGSTKITVSAVDGSKKKLTIKVNVVDGNVAEPTDEPTTEPTEEPAIEPTAEPTGEPTTEPTAEPTTEPTTKPTSQPPHSQGFPIEDPKPTPTPTVTPSPEPFTTLVEGEKEEDGSVAYYLDGETEYRIKAVVDGEEVEIKTNNGTFGLLNSAIRNLDADKSIDEIYDAFYGKSTSGGEIAFTPAAGVVVSMQKEAGTGTAKLNVTDISGGGMSGEYDFVMHKMADGECEISTWSDSGNSFGGIMQKGNYGSETYYIRDIRLGGTPPGILALLENDSMLLAKPYPNWTFLQIGGDSGYVTIDIENSGEVSMLFSEDYMKNHQIKIFK